MIMTNILAAISPWCGGSGASGARRNRRKMSREPLSSADPPGVQPPTHSAASPSVQAGSSGWDNFRRGWANVTNRDGEALDGVRRAPSPVGRRPSPTNVNSSEPRRPLTQLEVDDEIKALREQLKAVSLIDLEKAFSSGTHKQVDSLQFSRLFSKLGLTASPEAMKEIGRVTDNADGTLSKQELLEWLESEGGAESGALPAGDGELASRALELLGLQPGGAKGPAARQRSFQALSLFDSDGDGQARPRYRPLLRPLGPALCPWPLHTPCTCALLAPRQVDSADLRATWRILLDASLSRAEVRAVAEGREWRRVGARVHPSAHAPNPNPGTSCLRSCLSAPTRGPHEPAWRVALRPRRCC